ncbi:Cell division protein FtsW [hydrothermal vent metagenome]|uniref:Cell division protein FtsW n=1 Tax=hydrothermal vent metagenome TaxID=652676 RepID=A0A3B0SMC7_9ZZZZ
MTRRAEAGLIIAASILAALGVAIVEFTRGNWLDAQVAVTLLTFLASFGGVHLAVRRWAPGASSLLLPTAAFLSAVGFTEIYRINGDLAAIQRWSLLIAAAAAAGTLLLLADTGVEVLRKYRYLALAVGVALLLLPLLPDSWILHGATINGSRLWVQVVVPGTARTLSFQPGEIAKVLITVFLASYLAENANAMSVVDRKIGPFKIPEPRHLGPVMIAAAVAFVVLIYQRDLGASLLLFALFIGMLYIATSRSFYVIAGAVMTLAAGVLAYNVFGHVQRRIQAWINPFEYFSDAGYQTVQGLFAMGSGSLTGSGIGLGRPDLIPAATTDFIFAAIAEEMGFAGSLAIIAGFALLIAAAFGIAIRARDRFRKYLAGGLAIVMALQAIIIIGGVVRLLPVTGITLPFMSYGGSSLLASMTVLALLLRISHEERA